MKAKYLIIVIGMIIAGFTVLSSGKEVKAAGMESSYSAERMDKSGSPAKSGGILYAESSGVTELDAARTRVDKLIEWVCKWIGAVIALVALIAAIIMASSHQTEQRNNALVVMVFGVIIFFAPQIINYVLNK